MKRRRKIFMGLKTEFIARVRDRDKKIQSVHAHLKEVSELSEQFAAKINLPIMGQLIGLAHDLGKYSNKFQSYIRGATNLSGEEELKLAKSEKGKVDHATAGAQYISDLLCSKRGISPYMIQMLATCVACHHTGLYDYYGKENQKPFLARMKKSINETFVNEAIKNGDSDIIQELQHILSDGQLSNEFLPLFKSICLAEKQNKLRINFHLGLLTRYLFSCLIDADRLSSANFEKPKTASFRNTHNQTKWSMFKDRLERHLQQLMQHSDRDQLNCNQVNNLRATISKTCLEASSRAQGVFTLSVPTGGGKTLASLRFAIHHALHHSSVNSKKQIDRIIYVIPYTSIIEQNAKVVRDIFGNNQVLEHHSNIVHEKSKDVPDEESWRNRVLSENWDAPIVFTTSVQFLNALFDGSTGSVRRMHQLSNAVIIFDEVQSLPIKTVHLFNNAINFLTQTCGSSVVLCTATQPLLDRVDEDLGAIRLNSGSKIISDDHQLFADLRRTQIKNCQKQDGWSVDEVAALSLTQLNENGSVLIIVNTKRSALELYQKLYETSTAEVFHLSTNMCPAHRKTTLSSISDCLASNAIRPVICVSTQLIEAGVDIDFGSVIRYLAGLDSIAQAAGRCNRHGKRKGGLAPVLLVNPAKEDVDKLPDILKGQEIMKRILREFEADPASFDHDLVSPKAMERFYSYYFFERSKEMDYPISTKHNPEVGIDTNLLDLLSNNSTYTQRTTIEESQPLYQAFKTAGELFRVIDAPTEGIIVPYEKEGEEIISDLCSAFNTLDFPLENQVGLLRRAQQFTVNVFPNLLKNLHREHCIHEVQTGSGIYYLDKRHYNDAFGISLEETMKMTFLTI